MQCGVDYMQVLYEIALAFSDGDVIPPLSLFTNVPRKRVSENELVTTVACTSSVLVMEEDEDGWDPLLSANGIDAASKDMNISQVVHALLPYTSELFIGCSHCR